MTDEIRTIAGEVAASDEGSHVGTEEPRYTLEEASQILRNRVCAEAGTHQLSLVTNAENNPVNLICTVCGKQAPIDWPTS
jgi:hypothetical protein